LPRGKTSPVYKKFLPKALIHTSVILPLKIQNKSLPKPLTSNPNTSIQNLKPNGEQLDRKFERFEETKQFKEVMLTIASLDKGSYYAVSSHPNSY
jgi:hypothetical protein